MMKTFVVLAAFVTFGKVSAQDFIAYSHFIDPQHEVQCNASYFPPFCDLPNVQLSSLGTVEDFERCGPAVIPIPGRNYYWGAEGRKLTYYANINAYDKINIVPKHLRNVSNLDISTTILGSRIAMPIGLAPAAAQSMAYPRGEIYSARAATSMGTVTILSSLSTTSLEDVAAAAYDKANRMGLPEPILWMQIYILKNRQETYQMVKRAERAGYKALVVTCDAPKLSVIMCDAGAILSTLPMPNLFNQTYTSTKIDPATTFADITWLASSSSLPVVAKGILNGEDAVAVIEAGASAILVSNHGGRQQDTDPPTIEALTDVVNAVSVKHPSVEIYMDGGIRNGKAVFKALARGARAVFVGRPQLWGLGIAGEMGVRRVLTILKQEFNQTMMLAGINRARDITHESILPDRDLYHIYK